MMFHFGNFRRYGGFGIALCLALLISVRCTDPQSPPTPDRDAVFEGLYESAGTLEFRLETGSGDLSALHLLASDLVFDQNAQELHAQVALFNSGNQDLPGPQGVLVGEINPGTVVPLNAVLHPCRAAPGCQDSWEFMHAGTYGGDGILSPGETSSPVEWIFSNPTGEGFSFRAALRPADVTRSGVISGSVFADVNGDGQRQDTEPGLPGVAITLKHGEAMTTTTTGPAGGFEFQVEEAGLYEVVRDPANDCNPTTANVFQVFIISRADGTLSGFSGIAFGCRSVIPGDDILVSGIVFEDQNRDGIHQDGEPGLADVLITGAALSCPTFAPLQTRTDVTGHYTLRLPACPPPYVVSHEALIGFVDTSPNPLIFPGPGPGPIPVPVPLSTADDSTVVQLTADFGVAPKDSTQESSVEGVVFEDLNHNGLRDNNESGIAGVQVTGSGIVCFTPVLGITFTDAAGHYILRQSDVHCVLPWRIAHAGVEGMCDTSPNPVEIGYDRRPDPRFYRVDFGVAACDSLPAAGVLIVFVHWNGQGLPDRRLEIVELGQVQFTNAQGLARFTLPAGQYTLHADVNGPGPPLGVDFTVTVQRGKSTRLEVLDCLECVAVD